MAKTALINRDLKRAQAREEIRGEARGTEAIINNSKAPTRTATRRGSSCSKLPRNAMPMRLRNRCALTGRPRGMFLSSDCAQQAARNRDARRDPRRDQGELVNDSMQVT